MVLGSVGINWGQLGSVGTRLECRPSGDRKATLIASQDRYLDKLNSRLTELESL